MRVKVRRPRPEEWRELRALRLCALTEAPTAFGSTLAVEQAYPDAVWIERAIGASTGHERASFVAEADGTLVGMATGLPDHATPTRPGRVLVAMFVASSSRRQGIGASLVDAVSAWARDGGSEQLSLWVTSGNEAAAELYRRCGFAFSGETRPHAHAPGLTEQAMVRRL